MSSAAAVGARLSTTSEGLWLTAALAGVSRLPAVLKVRPIGDVELMLAGHRGLAVLDEAGVCRDGVLDADVAQWVSALGRPDVEVALTVSRPAQESDQLLGPPPPFRAPPDPLEAAEALRLWRASRPAQRAAALCRRDGSWVAAVRVWQAGESPLDEIVVSPLGQAAIGTVVSDLLGPGCPADFDGINIESEVLDAMVAGWQRRPGMDVIGELADAGLTLPQARVIAAAGDATATRAALTAMQYSVEGPVPAPRGAAVLDTLVGRVVISSLPGPDQRSWTTVFPGGGHRIATAVTELLESLPSGRDWATHRRVRPFDAC